MSKITKPDTPKKHKQEVSNIDGFITNLSLLEETPKINKDIVGFDTIKTKFQEFLKKIDKNAVVGLLGPFGSGKSTLLYLLEKDYETPNIKWITFDAWKYPDKKDLWEGFIFDFIQSTNPKKWNLIIFFKLVIGFIVFIGIPTLISIIFKIFHGHIHINIPMINWLVIVIGILAAVGIYIFSRNYILIAYQSLISLLSITQAKRVNDYYTILQNHINKDASFKNIEKIYIVVEDIDRAFQDGGIFFLETLNYFLKNYKLDKQVIVIVPLNSDYLNRQNTQNTDNEKPYLKSLDYTYDFTKHYDFATFAKELLDFNKIRSKNKSFNPKDCYDSRMGHDYEAIISQLTSIFRSAHSSGCSLRKIKLILRNSNTLYKTLDLEEKEKIDLRLWLIFSFARYISKIKLTPQTFSIGKYDSQLIMRLVYAIAKNDRLNMISNNEIPSKLNFVSRDSYLPQVISDSRTGRSMDLNNSYLQAVQI